MNGEHATTEGVKPPICENTLLTLELRYSQPKKSGIDPKFEELWQQTLQAKQWVLHCPLGKEAEAPRHFWPMLRYTLDGFMANGEIGALAEFVRAWNSLQEGSGPELESYSAEWMREQGFDWQSDEPMTFYSYKQHQGTKRHPLKIKILAAIGYLQKNRSPTETEIRDLLAEWDADEHPDLPAISRALKEMDLLPHVSHGKVPPQQEDHPENL